MIGHKDGFGFVVPDAGGDDLYINARQMRAAFHDDKVVVRVAGVDKRGRREAAIVEVIEHNTQQLVGRFIINLALSFIQPSNQRITRDILIPPEGQMLKMGKWS